MEAKKSDTFQFIGNNIKYADLTPEQDFLFNLLVNAEQQKSLLVQKLAEELGVEDVSGQN